MITQTAVLEDKYSACLLKVRISKNEKLTIFSAHTFLHYRGKKVYMVKVNFSLCLNTMSCRSM